MVTARSLAGPSGRSSNALEQILSIESLGKSIYCLRLIQDSRLITGLVLSAKSDSLVRRRICWRRCLSSSTRSNDKPIVDLATIFGNVCRRDHGTNWRPDRDYRRWRDLSRMAPRFRRRQRVCSLAPVQAPCNKTLPVLFTEVGSELDVDRRLNSPVRIYTPMSGTT